MTFTAAIISMLKHFTSRSIAPRFFFLQLLCLIFTCQISKATEDTHAKTANTSTLTQNVVNLQAAKAATSVPKRTINPSSQKDVAKKSTDAANPKPTLSINPDSGSSTYLPPSSSKINRSKVASSPTGGKTRKKRSGLSSDSQAESYAGPTSNSKIISPSPM